MTINPHATRDALDRETGYTAADEAEVRRPINKRDLFRAAWSVARFDHSFYGKPLREAFAKALREAWAAAKAANVTVRGPEVARATTDLISDIRKAKADDKDLFAGKAWRFRNVTWR